MRLASFLMIAAWLMLIAAPMVGASECKDQVMNRWLRHYLADYNSFAVSQCRQGLDKSILVVPVRPEIKPQTKARPSDKPDAVLIQLMRKGCAYNVADVEMGAAGLILGGTMGGAMTIETSKKLLEELSSYPFTLTPANRLDEALGARPARACGNPYGGFGYY